MKNQQERREEMAAYTTMFIVGALSVVLIGVAIQTIFNIIW
jgi:hypothetical protein